MNALQRTLMRIGCRDSDALPKVADAGRIVDAPEGRVQIMHNGLRVKAGGYHGDWMAQIIRALRGHHEPQEELIFADLMRYVRHNSLIVELGAFWSYYSLWYLREIPGSRAFCIEPDPASLAVGRFNAELNSMADRMVYRQAWVGDGATTELTAVCESDNVARTLPLMNMQAVSSLTGGQPIEMLHMDVQGAELGFLRSIAEVPAAQRPRFLVVSTHHSSISGSPTTHVDCVAELRSLGAHVLVEHSVQESFSGDGLIVASFLGEDEVIDLPLISRNEPGKSLFPSL